MTLKNRNKKLTIFLIFNFLITVYCLLFTSSPVAQDGNAVSTRIGEEVEAKNAFEITDIGVLLKNVLSISLAAAAILAFAYLMWGAIDWLVSEGDQEKLKSAKNKITHALIGLAIMALVWLIWRLTIYFLGIGVISEGQVELDLPDYPTTP